MGPNPVLPPAHCSIVLVYLNVQTALRQAEREAAAAEAGSVNFAFRLKMDEAYIYANSVASAAATVGSGASSVHRDQL